MLIIAKLSLGFLVNISGIISYTVKYHLISLLFELLPCNIIFLNFNIIIIVPRNSQIKLLLISIWNKTITPTLITVSTLAPLLVHIALLQ